MTTPHTAQTEELKELKEKALRKFQWAVGKMMVDIALSQFETRKKNKILKSDEKR